VLAALTAGYFLGGWLADRTASVAVLAVTVSSLRLSPRPPAFAEAVLEFVLADNRRHPAPAACSPRLPSCFSGHLPRHVFAVSPSGCCCARRKAPAWSRARSMASRPRLDRGTLGTTFFLIPAIGSRAIHVIARRRGCELRGCSCSRSLGLSAATPPTVALTLALRSSWPLPPRAPTPRRRRRARGDAQAADGQIAHIESEYNDIYVRKRRGDLILSFQLKGWDYTESVTNLRDPDDLPLALRRRP